MIVALAAMQIYSNDLTASPLTINHNLIKRLSDSYFFPPQTPTLAIIIFARELRLRVKEAMKEP